MFDMTQQNLPSTTPRSCCIPQLRQETNRTEQNLSFLLSQPLGKRGRQSSFQARRNVTDLRKTNISFVQFKGQSGSWVGFFLLLVLVFFF